MKLRNLLAGVLVAGLGCAALPAAAWGSDGLSDAVQSVSASDLRLAASPFPPGWMPPWGPPRLCPRIDPVQPYSSVSPRGIGYVPPWLFLCRLVPPPTYYPRPLA